MPTQDISIKDANNTVQTVKYVIPGTQVKADSQSVTLATDEDPIPVSSNQLPGTLGSQTSANSVSVVLANNHGALPLQTGAATQTTLADLNSKIPAAPATDGSVNAVRDRLPGTLGAKTTVNSLAVALPTDMQPLDMQEQPVPTAFSLTGALVNTTSAVVLAANGSRRSLLVQNQSNTATVYINPTGGAAVANQLSLKLLPNAYLSFDPNAMPTGQISAISTEANTPICVMEG
jgi:hypothetical protein